MCIRQGFLNDRLRRTVASLMLSACAATTAFGQESDTEEFDGQWTATIADKDRGARTATVVIANFGGSWQDRSGPRDGVDKLCRGKKFPITVQVSKPSEFEFTVWGSSIAPACPDLSMSFKPAGPKTLEGKVNGERAVTLRRK